MYCRTCTSRSNVVRSNVTRCIVDDVLSPEVLSPDVLSGYRCCTARGRCQADIPVARFNFGWAVVGRGSNSDNATSPDEAINHGRHSENILVVDDTKENVHFDGVWYTCRTIVLAVGSVWNDDTGVNCDNNIYIYCVRNSMMKSDVTT